MSFEYFILEHIDNWGTNRFKVSIDKPIIFVCGGQLEYIDQYKKEDKKSCKGNCSNCHSCSFTLVFNLENKNILDFNKSHHFISKKVENLYLQPHFSSLFVSIWQPPKIG